MSRVEFTIPHAWYVPTSRLILGNSPAFEKCAKMAQSLCLPFPGEAREASFAGEQFLHGPLFDLPLLGDELLQRVDEGVRVADSTFIRLHIEKKYGFDFDRGLDSEQRGIAWAFEKLAEDNLYWAILEERWNDDANFDKGPRSFFRGVPAPFRPIVIGMVLSTSMIACNYVTAQWLVVLIMALAFFGKGIGALGWAVVSDTSPKQIAGLSGGLFNTFGNTAAITTPIVIGYLVNDSGQFNGALVFVGANAVLATDGAAEGYGKFKYFGDAEFEFVVPVVIAHAGFYDVYVQVAVAGVAVANGFEAVLSSYFFNAFD